MVRKTHLRKPRKPVETTARAAEKFRKTLEQEGMHIMYKYIDLEHKLRTSAVQKYLSKKYADMNILFIDQKPYLVITYHGPEQISVVENAIKQELGNEQIEVSTNSAEHKIYVHRKSPMV